MEKIHTTIFVLIISSFLLISDARILYERRQKLATYRVYVHDIRAGPNATIHAVARADITATSPTSFGLVTVGDSLMTVGPDITSQKLGRVQGVSASSGSEEPAYNLNGAFIFTAGKYRGSTAATTGWIRGSNETQEWAIVGGTGVFRLSRGYIRSNLYSSDPANSYYLFQNDLYFYDDKKQEQDYYSSI